MSIPHELKASLESRIREQIACEVRGDVSALYNFTLPKIRAKRIAEHDFEPSLSLSEIQKFADQIYEAAVLSIDVEEFVASVPGYYEGCPLAVVVTRVSYNRRAVSTFRCIWVFLDGTWYSTALGKFCGW